MQYMFITVTGNEVWDRDLGQYLSYGYSLYHVNKFIVPIWTLNELQGGKSAVMMWGAGEFEFKGRHVSYHKALNKDIPREKRVDGVIDWLKKGVNLAMLYIDQPDKHGHGYGPNSAKVIFFYSFSYYNYSTPLWTIFIFLECLL